MHDDCPKVLLKFRVWMPCKSCYHVEIVTSFWSYLDLESQEDSKKHTMMWSFFHKTLKCVWKTLIHKNKVRRHILVTSEQCRVCIFIKEDSKFEREKQRFFMELETDTMSSPFRDHHYSNWVVIEWWSIERSKKTMSSSIKNLIASTKLRTTSKKEERALTKSVSRAISLRASRKASVNIEDVRERQEQSVVEELRILLSATNDLPPHLDDYHTLLRYIY